MNYEELKLVISIPKHEKELFKKMIRDTRAKLISSPSDAVEKAFLKNHKLLSEVKQKNNITEAICQLREDTYSEFLIEESDFNVSVLKNIGHQLNTPNDIIDVIIKQKLNLNDSKENILTQIKEVCGEYAGRISPYIYELCLSNTQSRRSRAGKTFEAVIYKMYETYSYSFSSQKKIGKATFQEHGLGKMVDSLLPGINEFEQRRDKTIIGTMKTTLRERWQEVIEELQRTGLPRIHLLTMDEDISSAKAQQMGRHNVIIVVPNYVKSKAKLESMRNIISFETYFLEEIPDIINYWEN